MKVQTHIDREERRTPGKKLKKEIRSAGFKYNWRKMEAAAQDRARWREVNVAYIPLRATRRHKSHTRTN